LALGVTMVDNNAMKSPALLLIALPALLHAAPVALFDGKTFDGWEAIRRRLGDR
jgi:hypothetical protein